MNKPYYSSVDDRWPEGVRHGPPGRQSYCPEPPSLEDHCKARHYAPVVEHATPTTTTSKVVRAGMGTKYKSAGAQPATIPVDSNRS